MIDVKTLWDKNSIELAIGDAMYPVIPHPLGISPAAFIDADFRVAIGLDAAKPHPARRVEFPWNLGGARKQLIL